MDLAALDATAQSELVRAGECTPAELVEAGIQRIEALDPRINAIIHRRFERAREEAARRDPARQPFAGVPLVVKDASCQQAGEPHHQGMRALRDADFRETRDAWLCERFQAAGFVILGRSNAPELCTLPTTEPQAYGPTRNPWSLEHSTGGSSGGSAAAVAAGLVPVAHGGDGGGSIRMPASCCGLVGLKPSRDRITRGPHEGQSWAGLSTDGVMTRSVRDTAAVFDCVAGARPGDPGHPPPLQGTLQKAILDFPGHPPLRIGVRAEAFVGADPPHPETLRALSIAQRALDDCGHRLEEGGPSEVDDPEIPTLQGQVVAACLAASVAEWGARIGREIPLGELEGINARTVEAGRALSAADYAKALDELHAYGRRVVAWWGDHDLLLTPTLTDPPPRLGEIHADLSPEEAVGLRRRFGWLTPPWNISGQPAISLPVHWSPEGLPIGVQLVAAPGREDLLVGVAAQLEAHFGWAERRAPIQA